VDYCGSHARLRDTNLRRWLQLVTFTGLHVCCRAAVQFILRHHYRSTYCSHDTAIACLTLPLPPFTDRCTLRLIAAIYRCIRCCLLVTLPFDCHRVTVYRDLRFSPHLLFWFTTFDFDFDFVTLILFAMRFTHYVCHFACCSAVCIYHRILRVVDSVPLYGAACPAILHLHLLPTRLPHAFSCHVTDLICLFCCTFCSLLFVWIRLRPFRVD